MQESHTSVQLCDEDSDFNELDTWWQVNLIMFIEIMKVWKENSHFL